MREGWNLFWRSLLTVDDFRRWSGFWLALSVYTTGAAVGIGLIRAILFGRKP